MHIFSFIYDAAELILSGLPIVILLTLASFFPALALGIVGGLLASSKFKALRMVVGAYVYVFRSTPFLMFIFFDILWIAAI
ncbi:ABC transporter permease subunit (plasmid) [Sinorhizobium meliloti]|nr:ABC transporter permease subunit [Sinorhizobium meliloti]WKL39082.1 ABC transporter permease subunit [Sinorhizobium meliloti]